MLQCYLGPGRLAVLESWLAYIVTILDKFNCISMVLWPHHYGFKFYYVCVRTVQSFMSVFNFLCRTEYSMPAHHSREMCILLCLRHLSMTPRKG